MADAFRFEIKIDHSQAIPALDALKDHTQNVTGKMSMAFNSVTAKITAATFAINQVSQAARLIGNALSYPLQQFKEFETAMANVASLGVENIDNLKSAVLDMGESVPLSFKNMADGLYQVVSAGVDADHQIQVLEASARAGVAGLASTTDALNLASAVIKGYGKSWAETNSVMDMAFQTVKLGQTTFADLSEAIGRVIPLASTLNVGTEELFGTFATLTGVTGNATEVATQLRGILAATAKPTKELTALMKSLGYESAAAAIKQEGLSGFLKIVSDATGGNADQMAKLFGRIEAVNAALALSGKQYDTFLKKTEAMRQSTGAMDEAFKTNANTIENHWQILMNKFNKRLIEAVEFIKPVINSLMDFGSALLSINFDYFIAGLSAAGTALAAFGIAKMVTEVGSLGPALATATKAVWAFATESASAMATATGGITILTGAIAGLITYLVLSKDDEAELAQKRAETAQKTIELVEAEKKRVEQSIATQGATEDLTNKLDKLNKKLLAQQKILSDAKLDEYKARLKDAVDDLNDLHQGLYDMFTEKAHILGALQRKYGENYIAMEEEVTNRMAEISDKLYQQKVGYINLSEDQISEMKDEQEAYNTIMEYLSKAADAQRAYNAELERNKELHEETINSETQNTITNQTENKVSNSVNFKVNHQQVYEILTDLEDTSIQIPVEVPEESLDHYIERVKENFDQENELLQLKYDNGLISEEEYNNQKEALLDHELAIYKKYLGAESKEYLKLHKEKIKREKEQTRIKIQQEKLRQQAAYNTVMGGLDTLENVMSIVAQKNRDAFEIYKGIQVTKTIISTIKAAQDAFAYGMEHGGPIVAGVLTIAAVTAGMARVAQIEAQKPPKYAAGGLVDFSGRVVQTGNFGDGENRLIIANDGEFIVNREATIRYLPILKAMNENENFTIAMPVMAEGGEVSTETISENPMTIINQNSTGNLDEIIDRLEAIESAIKELELNADISDTELAITVKNGNKKIEKVIP